MEVIKDGMVNQRTRSLQNERSNYCKMMSINKLLLQVLDQMTVHDLDKPFKSNLLTIKSFSIHLFKHFWHTLSMKNLINL